MSKKEYRASEEMDPDFVELTPEEKRRLDEAETEMERGEYYTEEEVWNQ